MVPGDGTFTPYEYNHSDSKRSPTNGRIFVLKFQSSTQRYLFWLQSKNQHPQDDSAWFSPRDLKLGQVIDRLLQGESVNVAEAVANASSDQSGNGDNDRPSTPFMEDLRSETPGGASEHMAASEHFMDGTDKESESSRTGGADGGTS